ncbi:MAG: response regulator, partial [Bacteroidales bacterium]|nr:response regulator [Bacteroidales bacterium]
INPEKISKSYYMPPIVLTNFQIFNKNVDIHDKDAPFKKNIEYLDEIVLDYYQSSFSIEYAALSFFDPKKNKYAYQLKNFENEWNEVGNLNRATYTNLSSGNYEFLVKAANWDGTWNNDPRTLKITILPPWWKTTLAYIIYIVLSIIILEIARRIISRYAHMRNDLKVERRVNEIKLQFFTNISHEIRTPLTLLLGPLHDIKTHSKLPNTVLRSLDIMERNGKRMLRLVNQLLDFRKIQKKKMKLKVRKIELIGFVKEVCENFNQIAKQKKINFKFQSDYSFQHVWVDPDKFDSVLFNILSNAFKFTKENKNIDVKILSGTNDFIEVKVIDEGKGIPEDKIPFLFQRFSPLSGSDVNFDGTGIGLALSSEIMKLHKGEITADSKVNVGSCFTIRIRLGNGHFSNEELVSEDDTVEVQKHKKIEIEEVEIDNEINHLENEDEEKTLNKILIVEDNHDIKGYISDSLKDSFEIYTAANGKQGYEIILEHHPDIIVTDVMMPEMDGIQMTKLVKENFETSHIPVVMLTAKSLIKDQIDGIESGAEAYILKPFNSEYLRAVISNLLKQRENIIRKYRDKKEYNANEIKITSKDEEFMNNIVQTIEKHYSDPEFNVEKLAEKSNYGRTVMYNKIKGLTGVSPVDFLRQMRLKKAANLLINSDYNVSEVAYMTGFSDVKYFSKRFKTLFNILPKEYKDQKNIKLN